MPIVAICFFYIVEQVDTDQFAFVSIVSGPVMDVNAIISTLLFFTWTQIGAAATLYKTYVFNEQQRTRLINEHNRLRAQEPAKNMQKLVWDDSLAELARQHAATCNAWHRDVNERKGFGYSYIGENIWWSNEWYLRDNLESVIQMFYNEKSDYHFYTFQCNYGRLCGHYTALVWADTCAVGCGASYCDGIYNGRGIRTGHIIVCNYGPGGNWPGQYPYIVGQRLTQCPGGVDGNLCASQCQARFSPKTPLAARPKPPPPPPSPVSSKKETKKLPVTHSQKSIRKPIKQQQQVLNADICRDYQIHCAYWQRIGECNRNPNYMRSQCQLSCNMCKGQHNPAPRLPLGNRPSSQVCYDNHIHCDYWRSRGECSRNPAYMLRQCRASCNVGNACAQTFTSTAQSCGDFHQSCAYWASIGECARNVAYMKWQCRRSCHWC